MSNEPFMAAVVDAILFFELCDSKVVDDDAAVEMLEQIASTLRRLAPPEKAKFIGYVQTLATKAHSENERQTLERLAANMGLKPE